ncbi:MAG TPA: preprotein translocase subunit SecY [Dehalococcoidia bacterium]|nr:preprotein translocase subunit SecY [Dehalococcoidia bacterium]
MTQERREGRPKLLQAMIDAFGQADLRKKILLTIGLLVIFRFIAHVPVPGADVEAMRSFLEGGGGIAGLVGMMDLFSGGAMRNMSIAALGVYPYITAVIIMQLMVPVIPRLQAIAREGDAGRAKINQYTHWLTVPLAILQGYGQLIMLQGQGIFPPGSVGLSGDALLPTITMVLAFTAGTMFLVWLGELITEYGIGNGVSMIIFAGIVCTLPEMLGRGYLAGGELWGLFIFLGLALAILVTIVIFNEAHRRIPVQYARSLYRGGRMYRQSGGTHIPIRVNSAGMIPVIFAMALLIFPGVVASFFADPTGGGFANTIVNLFSQDSGFYWAMYFFLVMSFTFFYAMIVFQQQNLGETLQRQGAFVPGIRPGKTTQQYLNRIITRITWAGALFLAFVAISPFILQNITGVQVLVLPSIGMLIVVGVALDTMRQLEAQLMMRRYEGFLK